MAMKRNRKRNSFSYPILLVGKLEHQGRKVSSFHHPSQYQEKDPFYLVVYTTSASQKKNYIPQSVVSATLAD